MAIKQSSMKFTEHVNMITTTHFVLSDNMFNEINFPFSLTSKQTRFLAPFLGAGSLCFMALFYEAYLIVYIRLSLVESEDIKPRSCTLAIFD